MTVMHPASWGWVPTSLAGGSTPPRSCPTHLGVYPELVEKVELFVHQEGRGGHCQGHRQVEYLKQVDTHILLPVFNDALHSIPTLEWCTVMQPVSY